MRVLIEAGVKGWEIIEYREFLKSAQEYFGEPNVQQLVIRQRWLQPLQLFLELFRGKYDVYIFSPRTLSSSYLPAIFQAFLVLIITSVLRVRVHSCLSDAQIRLFRHLSLIVCMHNGVIHCLISPTPLIRSYFPFANLRGPYMLPISRITFDYVDEICKTTTRDIDVCVPGLLYRERREILEPVICKLKDQGFHVVVSQRSSSGKRSSDYEYWKMMASAKIVLTTSVPTKEVASLGLDNSPHLIYRYLEALVCGSLLVCNRAPSNSFIEPNIHYVPFDSGSDIYSIILYFLENTAYAQSVSLAGRDAAKQIIETYVFWSQITR